MKRVFTIICAITMMLTVLAGCGVNRKNLYDAENKDILLGNLFFIEAEAEEVDEPTYDIDSQKTDIDSMYYKMKNIRRLEGNELRNLEKLMTKFFEVNYNVDISKKFEGIETYLFDLKDDDIFLKGMHLPGDNKVYINREIHENSHEEFAFTWCHEIIHFLGINYENNNFWGLYEAVTEAVNINLMDWMNIPYNSESSAYWNAANIGKQLISANPELVSRSISDDNFYLEDSINEILNDANYPEARLPENTTIAYQLNAYLVCMIQKNQMYMYVSEYMNFAIQEITTAYCRKFNLSEKQIEFAKKYWIFENFDHTTIKSGKDYIEFKR